MKQKNASLFICKEIGIEGKKHYIRDENFYGSF